MKLYAYAQVRRKAQYEVLTEDEAAAIVPDNPLKWWRLKRK
jgi:hypothetical protein